MHNSKTTHEQLDCALAAWGGVGPPTTLADNAISNPMDSPPSKVDVGLARQALWDNRYGLLVSAETSTSVTLTATPTVFKNAKQCSKCKRELTRADFQRHRSRPDLLQPWCRTCQRQAVRENDLRRVQGVSVGAYYQAYREAHGRCAICDRASNYANRALVLDHCHETGKTRGILCDPCNMLLGRAKDDPAKLREWGNEKAAQYLEQHGR